MKNKKLTDEERKLVCSFLKMEDPLIYKTDKTDRILFVEMVDFDVCSFLLGKRNINNEQFSYILNEYERFLKQTDFSIIVTLMDIFKKVWGKD